MSPLTIPSPFRSVPVMSTSTLSTNSLSDHFSSVTVKMIRWLKKHTRRSRKAKPDSIEPDSLNEPRSDFLDHTYEEIPDVIPTGWRGIRSDSVPSFFLVGTSGVLTDSEDSVLENSEPYSVVSLSESLCSYETPTSCLDSAEELSKLGRLAEGSDGETVLSASDADTGYSEETASSAESVYSYCSRDKLSCVRASCDHSHEAVDNTQLTNLSTVQNTQYTKHSGTQDVLSLTSVSSVSSVCDSDVCVSNVYSDDICVSEISCDQVVIQKALPVVRSNLVPKGKRSTADRINRGRVNGFHPRLVNSRNRLLDDLIRGNYDRRMLAF